MPRTKSHSGNNKPTYRYEDSQIEVLPYFLYEVSVYEIRKNRFNILGSKMYTSNKFLRIRNDVKTLKKTREYEVIQFVDLLGAPQSFIEENNLPIYELQKRKKNEKRKN